MAAETLALRNKARRLKDLAISRAIKILENPEDYTKELYDETYRIVLKNSVPQTRELTGEEGEAIKISFDPVFNGTSNTTSETTGDSGFTSEV